ncbi:response regulator [Natronorubrum halophilum]|uniref:response regulator n=1 Tax=Natronorubrum halophilum TaxID=1702106 RepID=UPI000EF6F47B|nr:response regulator [Natronorubrum halophilum]
MSDHHFKRVAEETAEILLVEDNPGDIRLTEEAFKATDTETTLHSITTGDRAVDFLTRQIATESASLPDFVLLDLNLPGKNGCEVLEAIRSDPQLKPLPVIVLTSSEAAEDIERCYDARANAYLTKPKGPDEFEALAKAVEKFWFEQARFPSPLR